MNAAVTEPQRELWRRRIDEALLATGQMPERPARWELALAFERKSFETAVSQEDYERKIETKLREMRQMYVGRPQPQQQAQPPQQPRVAASAPTAMHMQRSRGPGSGDLGQQIVSPMQQAMPMNYAQPQQMQQMGGVPGHFPQHQQHRVQPHPQPVQPQQQPQRHARAQAQQQYMYAAGGQQQPPSMQHQPLHSAARPLATVSPPQQFAPQSIQPHIRAAPAQQQYNMAQSIPTGMQYATGSMMQPHMQMQQMAPPAPAPQFSPVQQQSHHFQQQYGQQQQQLPQQYPPHQLQQPQLQPQHPHPHPQPSQHFQTQQQFPQQYRQLQQQQQQQPYGSAPAPQQLQQRQQMLQQTQPAMPQLQTGYMPVQSMAALQHSPIAAHATGMSQYGAASHQQPSVQPQLQDSFGWTQQEQSAQVAHQTPQQMLPQQMAPQQRSFPQAAQPAPSRGYPASSRRDTQSHQNTAPSLLPAAGRGDFMPAAMSHVTSAAPTMTASRPTATAVTASAGAHQPQAMPQAIAQQPHFAQQAPQPQYPPRHQMLAEAVSYFQLRERYLAFIQKVCAPPLLDRSSKLKKVVALRNEVETTLNRLGVRRPEELDEALLRKVYELTVRLKQLYKDFRTGQQRQAQARAASGQAQRTPPSTGNGLPLDHSQAEVKSPSMPPAPAPAMGADFLNGTLPSQTVVDVLSAFLRDRDITPTALYQAYVSGQVWNKFGPLLAAVQQLCKAAFLHIPAELARLIPHHAPPVTPPTIPGDSLNRVRTGVSALCRQLSCLEGTCGRVGLGEDPELQLASFLGSMTAQLRELLQLLGGSAVVAIVPEPRPQPGQVIKRALCYPLSNELSADEQAMVPMAQSLTVAELIATISRVCKGTDRVQVEIEGLSSPVSPVGRGPRQARLVAVRVEYSPAAALYLKFDDTHGYSETADHRSDLISTPVHIPAIVSCEAALPFDLPQLAPALHCTPDEDAMPFVSIHGTSPIRTDVAPVRSAPVSLRAVSAKCDELLRRVDPTAPGLHTFTLLVRRAAASNWFGDAAEEISNKRLKVEPSGEVVAATTPAVLDSTAVHYTADTADSDLTHFLEDFDDPSISLIGLV